MTQPLAVGVWLLQITNAVAGEALELTLAGVGATDVPLIGGQAHCEDAASERRRGCEVDDAGAAVVHHMVPCAEHGRVGEVLPCFHHIGIGSQAIGVEVPHAVVVAFMACTLEGVDAALIETAHEVHTPVDVVTGVVVNLSLGIADDGLRAPDVVVGSALATAIDARSIGVGYTAHGHGELGGMVGEEEVATVVGESLQGLDGGGGGQVAWQVLPSAVDADAVAHHPAHGVGLDVEVIDGGGGEEHALTSIHIVLLEPSHGVFLIVGGGVYASGISCTSFLKKNIGRLKGKKILVYACAASPYDKKFADAIIEMNMKDELKGIPVFYCRGAFDMNAMSFTDRTLCKMLRKAVAKKDPKDWELWEGALMECKEDEGCDWTDKSYLEPIIEAIRA